MLTYLFLQERETIKSINHAMNILNLEHNANTQFSNCVCYSGLAGLCPTTGYKTINHGMLTFFPGKM